MLGGLLFEVCLSQSQRSTQERAHDLELKAWGARDLAHVQEKASMTIELAGKDCESRLPLHSEFGYFRGRTVLVLPLCYFGQILFD